MLLITFAYAAAAGVVAIFLKTKIKKTNNYFTVFFSFENLPREKSKTINKATFGSLKMLVASVILIISVN